jgi:hypothetical protein
MPWKLRAAFLYVIQFVTYGVVFYLYWLCTDAFLVQSTGALMLALLLTMIIVALAVGGFFTTFRTQAIYAWRAAAIRRGDTAVLDGDDIWDKDLFMNRSGDWVTVAVKNPDGITRADGTHFAFGAKGVIPRGATVSAIGLPRRRDVLCRYESSPSEQTENVALPTGTWFSLRRLEFVTSTERYLATEQDRLRALKESQQAADQAARAEQLEKSRMTKCATP